MTIQEFSDNFDTLVNSYLRFTKFDNRQAPDSIDFTEYEKSLFLTKAQEELVKQIYSENYVPNSFESNEEARRQLSPLITQLEVSTPEGVAYKISDHLKHYVYGLTQTQAKECWYIVYEQVKLEQSEDPCLSEKILDVIPVTHDEYRRIIRNPFREPNSRKVLRLDNGNLKVEIVSKYDIDTYLVRYIRKPLPIILCDLSADGLFIDGLSQAEEGSLPSLLHQEILDRAVQLALATRLPQKIENNDNV